VSRTVRDTAAWLEATQTRAPNALFPPVPLITKPIDRPLRIHAYSTIMRTSEAPDASVSRVFAETIELLGTLGHRVSDAGLPFDGQQAVHLLHDITEGMFVRRLDALSQYIGTPIDPAGLEYRSATLVAAGKNVDDERFGTAWREMDKIAAAYLARLDEIDIWMTDRKAHV